MPFFLFLFYHLHIRNASIMSEVERIAVLPTKGEQLEFVDTAAKYIKEK